jgi:hypothetical protein
VIHVETRRAPERCAYCHDDGVGVVACASCGVALHAECWTHAGRSCPTIGCAERRPPRPVSRLRFTPEARQFVLRWLSAILALWGVSLVGTSVAGSDIVIVPALATLIAVPAMQALAVLAIAEASRRRSARPLLYYVVALIALLVLVGMVGRAIVLALS